MCNCNEAASKKQACGIETHDNETCAKPSRGMERRRSQRNQAKRSQGHQPGATDTRVRGILAVSVVSVILFNAAVTIFVPDARAVFEQLFQVLMLVIGYYFGRR
jgi:hypothetical protein